MLLGPEGTGLPAPCSGRPVGVVGWWGWVWWLAFWWPFLARSPWWCWGFGQVLVRCLRTVQWTRASLIFCGQVF